MRTWACAYTHHPWQNLQDSQQYEVNLVDHDHSRVYNGVYKIYRTDYRRCLPLQWGSRIVCPALVDVLLMGWSADYSASGAAPTPATRLVPGNRLENYIAKRKRCIYFYFLWKSFTNRKWRWVQISKACISALRPISLRLSRRRTEQKLFWNLIKLSSPE